MDNSESIEDAESSPRPAPRPTYAPVMLALGVTMLFWGLTTSPVMSVGGLVFFVWAMWMWMREIFQTGGK